MSNSLGKIFKLTTFGESHGPAIGGVIDGCPAGLELDFDAIQQELERRKPGQSKITTQRKEPDQVEFLSGIFEGKTTGTSIGFQIRNTNQRSKDYSHNVDVYRPSHADYTYDQKYGIRDHRGGGRSSVICWSEISTTNFVFLLLLTLILGISSLLTVIEKKWVEFV